jgi:preprotein translocase subunit YajC
MSSLVAAESTGSGSSLLIFLPILLLFGWIFYTGRRRTREALRLQSALSVGDEVTTTSGMLGRIVALDEEVATLEVSRGVSIRFNRRAIAGPAPTGQDLPTATSPSKKASSESGDDSQSDPTRPTN